MGLRISRGLKSFKNFAATRPITLRYGIDGVLAFGAVSMASNNNNLFAQRLGAGDFHLSMLMFLPQILILFLLVPMGLFTDSLRNKRRMLSVAMVAAAVFFAVSGVAAFLQSAGVYFFLGMIAMATFAVGMMNLAWQAYFPEVVPDDGEATTGEVETRNNVLTFRARMTMIISLFAPLAIGAILTAIPSDDGKIITHQVFYVLAAVLLIINALHFRKIKATRPAAPKRVSFAELKTAAKRLSKNKAFIWFALVVLFFHITWQADWTLYFIGQRNYLEMNELFLSLSPVLAMLAQLITLKRWSKNNARQGVELPIVYGIIGLALCPVAMILGVMMPVNWLGITMFLMFHFIGHLGFANITLNLFQCLLKVVDEEYRSFSISVYTMLITLSHAVMPVAGIALYRGLGGNRSGLMWAFAILFFARMAAAGLWVLYYRSRRGRQHAE